MKSLYKSLTAWLLCLFYVFSSFIVSFADVNSLMIASSSNALMTLDLYGDDFAIMPYSSLASISNTVDYKSMSLFIRLIDNESGMQEWVYPNIIQPDGTYRYYVPSGKTMSYIGFFLSSGALPGAGKYRMQIDNYSDVSYDLLFYDMNAYKTYKNANNESSSIPLTGYLRQSSGDYYIDCVLDMGNITGATFYGELDNYLSSGSLFAGTIKFNFSKSSAQANASTVGTGDLTQDYENDVSSSLSDLSSSVDSMTEDLSSAAENLEYISTSQNLIIQGIDNVIMHISDQLYAFWDQLFNLIHLPTLAKMDDIISAINNMDLEIEVNLDGLKTTINNMSTAVQNKLQSTTDKITGGYDNSGITQENEKLEQSINQYDEVESGIFEDAEGFIGDFEYPSVDSLPLGIIKALAFVGSFLQGIFLCMGEFSVIITFSLTMIFVMVVVGYHRIRS